MVWDLIQAGGNGERREENGTFHGPEWGRDTNLILFWIHDFLILVCLNDWIWGISLNIPEHIQQQKKLIGKSFIQSSSSLLHTELSISPKVTSSLGLLASHAKQYNSSGMDNAFTTKTITWNFVSRMYAIMKVPLWQYQDEKGMIVVSRRKLLNMCFFIHQKLCF